MDNTASENALHQERQLRGTSECIISGIVYGESQSNPGEEVELLGIYVNISPLDRNASSAQRLKTDIRGDFESGFLSPGAYKLTFTDPAGIYSHGPIKIDLKDDEFISVEMYSEKKEKEKKKEKENHSESNDTNNLSGWTLNRQKKPIVNVSVNIKSVTLKKPNRLSKLARIITRNKTSKLPELSVNISVRSNRFGKFYSGRSLPNGSYIITCTDPQGKFKFTSKFIALTGKHYPSLLFIGYGNDDLEELRKKLNDNQIKKPNEDTPKKEEANSESKPQKKLSDRLKEEIKKRFKKEKTKDKPTSQTQKPQLQEGPQPKIDPVRPAPGEQISTPGGQQIPKPIQPSAVTQVGSFPAQKPTPPSPTPKPSGTLYRQPQRIIKPVGRVIGRSVGFAGRGVNIGTQQGYRASQAGARASVQAAEAGIRAGATAARIAATTGTRGAMMAARGVAMLAATPWGWVIIIVCVVIFLIIILFFFFFGGGRGGSQTPPTDQNQTGTNPGNNGGRLFCGGTGSLDYVIPIRDTSVLPQNIDQLKADIVSRWPSSKIENFDHIVNRSIEAGWNPSFILTLWVEESGAQNGVSFVDGNPDGYTDALGCDPKHPTNNIDKSLNCVFDSYQSRTNEDFENLMCIYGGDDFHEAPCTFARDNVNFPGGVKDWYTRITGGVTAASQDPVTCGPKQSGDWPTTGRLSQGPHGPSSHQRLYDIDGRESLDIGNLFGSTPPPIYSSFDGTVTDVHDCRLDGTCSSGYGNSVTITTNNGGFSVLYGHLSEISVSSGQEVKVGEQLGIMGTTGNSSGVHLHWEFRGIQMATPNIPENITPPNCDDSTTACTPTQIAPGARSPNI